MTKVSIILPTYNERENIKLLVDEIITNVPPVDYEVIIVDDNSPDGTGEIAKNLSKYNRAIKTIIRTKDKGLAKSIKEGIMSSQGETIVVMDTDFSHPPSTVPKLFENLEDYDMVVASRYVAQGEMEAPWHKYFGSFILNKAISIILGLKIKDSTGGFFILKRNALENIDINKVFTGYGEFCFRLIYTLEKHNKKIKEIPFRYAIRRYGKSKTNLIKIGLEYLYEALKARLSL